MDWYSYEGPDTTWPDSWSVQCSPDSCDHWTGISHWSDCSPVSSQGTTASVRPSDYNQTNIVTTNRFLSEVGLSAGQETLLSDCAIEMRHKHNDK